MKILLIEPSEPWITQSERLKHYEQVILPVGLMNLSAYLKKKLGSQVQVKIVSTMVDMDSLNDLPQMIEHFSPDLIGIRSVIFYRRLVRHIIQVSKEIVPDVFIVVGGPDISSGHSSLMNHTDVDIFVHGEGESTFHEIVALRQKHRGNRIEKHLHHILGISFYSDGKLIRTEDRPPIKDLDHLPIPDYDAIDLKKYQNFLNYGYNRRKMGVLFTSRGCPFHCIYCHKVFGKRFRSRSAENILQEINKLYHKFAIEDFSIIDDNFGLDRSRLEKFTELMITKGPKVRLYLPNGMRADLLTNEHIDALIAAGVIWITFSLETSSKRLQKVIRKHMNISKLKQIVEYTCGKDVITNLCVMVGFPDETMDEANATLDFLSKFKKLVLPYYFSVKFYPGTALHDQALASGIKLDCNMYDVPYHNFVFQQTPEISNRNFELLNYRYLSEIFINSERLENAIRILRGHFSDQEIKDMFTVFIRKKITSIEVDIMGRH